MDNFKTESDPNADFLDFSRDSAKIKTQDQAEKKTDQENAFRDFEPSKPNQAGGQSSDFEIPEEEVFDFAKEKFEGLVKDQKPAAISEDGKITEKAGALSPEMIEISSEMYVEILETVWGSACEWFSGVSGNYEFEKKMKAKYKEVTRLYFAVQNVSLTPSHFFALMTVFVLFGSGSKAWKDKKRKKQAAEGSKAAKATIVQMEQSRAERSNSDRKYFTVEDGQYRSDPLTGAYVKKSDREDVPANLLPFLMQFKERENRFPSAKEVKEFTNKLNN